jgi:hypothetical protein
MFLAGSAFGRGWWQRVDWTVELGVLGHWLREGDIDVKTEIVREGRVCWDQVWVLWGHGLWEVSRGPCSLLFGRYWAWR